MIGVNDMSRIRNSISCVALAFLASPAVAAPNVFWIFGFDPGYAYGAGGRAEATSSVRLASLDLPLSDGIVGSRSDADPLSLKIASSQNAVTGVVSRPEIAK